MYHDSELEYDDRRSITDSIEWFVDRTFSILTKVFLPWKWFQGPNAENYAYIEQGKSRKLSTSLRYRMAMMSEMFVGGVLQAFEWIEIGVGRLFSIAGYAFRSKRQTRNETYLGLDDEDG